MTNFNELVEQSFGTMLSPLMQGRGKGTTEELIELLDVKLIDFDLVQTDEEVFTVVLFEEFPEKFFFGGKSLTDFATKVIQNGMYEDFKNSGGIRLQAERRTTKKKKNYTAFKLV